MSAVAALDLKIDLVLFTNAKGQALQALCLTQTEPAAADPRGNVYIFFKTPRLVDGLAFLDCLAPGLYSGAHAVVEKSGFKALYSPVKRQPVASSFLGQPAALTSLFVDTIKQIEGATAKAGAADGQDNALFSDYLDIVMCLMLVDMDSGVATDGDIVMAPTLSSRNPFGDFAGRIAGGDPRAMAVLEQMEREQAEDERTTGTAVSAVTVGA